MAAKARVVNACKYLIKFERRKKLIDLLSRRRFGRDNGELIRVRSLCDKTCAYLPRLAVLTVIARAVYRDFRARHLAACSDFNLNRMRGRRGVQVARQAVLEEVERGLLCRGVTVGQVDRSDGKYRVTGFG